MDPDEVLQYSYVLIALFTRCRDFPGHLSNASCQRLLRLITRHPSDDPAETFRRAGEWQAQMRLSQPLILDWAHRIFLEDRVLTLLHPSYPRRLKAAIGEASPPTFWKLGELPRNGSISVSGSRIAPQSHLDFAWDAGKAAAKAGFSVISGGAAGCDRSAESAALSIGGFVVRILPHGLHRESLEPGVCKLSVCEPHEPFSIANAMERNTLVHAFSSRSLIAHARLGDGGTWHGARDAFRRRLSQFFVPDCFHEPWCRALCNLGATPLLCPEDIASPLLDRQPSLTLPI